MPGRLLSVALLLSLCAGGCMRVKPYQREHLAGRAMTSDRGPGEARFDQHARGAREGADGGGSEPGGGCGCN